MSSAESANGLPEPSPDRPRGRALTLRAAAFGAAIVLAVAFLGLVAGPSDTSAQVVMWLLVLGATGLLMAVVFLTQGVPRQLEEEYEKNLSAVTARFEKLSARDWLTGLLTPAEFVGAAKMELARSKRYGRQMALAVVEPDRDGIAGIRGRDGADEAAARYMADALTVVLRETDVLGRRGEFGVSALLPETDAPGAAVVAERILIRFERSLLTLPDGNQIALPVNVAVVTYPADGDDATVLMERVSARAA